MGQYEPMTLGSQIVIVIASAGAAYADSDHVSYCLTGSLLGLRILFAPSRACIRLNECFRCAFYCCCLLLLVVHPFPHPCPFGIRVFFWQGRTTKSSNIA